MITCVECNAENFDGALYCENCGADLEGILTANRSRRPGGRSFPGHRYDTL